jgi:hypothetical protein
VISQYTGGHIKFLEFVETSFGPMIWSIVEKVAGAAEKNMYCAIS